MKNALNSSESCFCALACERTSSQSAGSALVTAAWPSLPVRAGGYVSFVQVRHLLHGIARAFDIDRPHTYSDDTHYCKKEKRTIAGKDLHPESMSQFKGREFITY